MAPDTEAAAQGEADVIVWDGGNNDFPFLRPDLHIVVADALRPDDARGYYPGEAVLRTGDEPAQRKARAEVRRIMQERLKCPASL